jgi:hypothetical protein
VRSLVVARSPGSVVPELVAAAGGRACVSSSSSRPTSATRTRAGPEISPLTPEDRVWFFKLGESCDIRTARTAPSRPNIRSFPGASSRLGAPIPNSPTCAPPMTPLDERTKAEVEDLIASIRSLLTRPDRVYRRSTPVDGQDLAGDEPIERMTDRGQPLLGQDRRAPHCEAFPAMPPPALLTQWPPRFGAHRYAVCRPAQGDQALFCTLDPLLPCSLVAPVSSDNGRSFRRIKVPIG